METQGDSNTAICENAGRCGYRPCRHAQEHEYERFACGVLNCIHASGECHCIPLKAAPDPDAKWYRLRQELNAMAAQKVRAIDPVLVLRFMDYIAEATK